VSRGKYLSLEEARKKGKQGKDKLQEFAKEHASEGDKKKFDVLFEAMANVEPAKVNKPKNKSRGAATSK